MWSARLPSRSPVLRDPTSALRRKNLLHPSSAPNDFRVRLTEALTPDRDPLRLQVAVGRRNTGGAIWPGVSMALMVLGAFGPWLKGPLGLSVSGTDGSNDGWLVVAVAVLAALFLFPYVRYSGSIWLTVLGGLCGIAGCAITIS